MDTENVAKATMMNRLHDALTGDEFYLIAMALANLETSFSEQPAKTVAARPFTTALCSVADPAFPSRTFAT